MILHYLKVAVRSQMRFKMQNLIAILGLAVSLFCFSICLYCSRFIFSTDSCFRNKDRIMEVHLFGKDGVGYSGTNGQLAGDLRNQGLSTKTFCTVVYPEERTYQVEVSEEKLLPYTLMCMETDSVYHEIFTPEILFGSWEQATHGPNSVILFESAAERLFGKAELAIGKHMILSHRLHSSPDITPRDGGISYTIQAVAKDLPLNNSLNFLRKMDALVINDTEGMIHFFYKNVTGATTYTLVRDDRELSKLMDEISKRKLVYRMFDEDASIRFEEFGAWLWKGNTASYFCYTTLIAGILVLLVGLLNFLHFITGSFFIRVRECHIRRVNGAGFKDLFLMFFVQICLSIFLSAFFTFLLIELLSPFLKFALVNISFTIEPDVLMWQVFTYFVGLMALCVAISLFVIFRIRRSYVNQSLGSSSARRYGRHRLRNISLGIQLFVGWIFISFAVALYLQSDKTSHFVFGTLSLADKERILSIPFDFPFLDVPAKRYLVEEIRKCPGVEDVVTSERNYMQGNFYTGLYLTEERDYSLDPNAMCVSSGFFKFMNLEIQSGCEQNTTDELVVDEALAKRIDKDLLGTVLYDYQKGYKVTGISAPMVTSNYSEGQPNGFMFTLSDYSDDFMHCYVKCSADRQKEAMHAVQHVMRKALPESVEIKMRTMMDDIREHYALEFELRNIVLFMAVVALIISLLGIYSAITLDTEHRRKEMAIRKINGAGTWQIVLLFARLYLVLVLTTAVVAFPIVDFLLGELRGTYHSFIDTGFLFYGGILLFVGLLITLAVYARIRDISRINPAEIIRSE